MIAATTYRRSTDGALMIEVAPHQAVNSVSARALGLIAADARFAGEKRPSAAPDIAKPAARPARVRPTEAEFDELKRKRDAAVAATVDRVCAEQGWDRGQVGVHASHAGECYCACPDGPCQHIWDGPDHEEDNLISATCSRCSAVEAYHDMRVMP